MLFDPIKLRDVEIQNRLMHAATYEGMAAQDGEISDAVVNRYRKIAKAGTGLIIPGYMSMACHAGGLPVH